MQLFLSPGFNIKTLRKKPQSAAQKLIKKKQHLAKKSLTDISKILSAYIPQSLFDEEYRNSDSRRRIFSIENTFWGFFLQILNQDSSSASVVHAFRIRYFQKNNKHISASNSAYCQAKKRLSFSFVRTIFEHVTQQNNAVHPKVNRRVISADGTGLTAADTAVNQQVWPQQKNQKLGCAFPQLRLCALFNLHSGTTLSYRLGNKKSHELKLLREQRESFKKGDIFIGDKGFICYFDQAQLKQMGVDSIVALAKRKPVSPNNAIKKLAPDDYLISLDKPKDSTQTRMRYDALQWDSLMKKLLLRQIKVTVSNQGFRVKTYYIFTTLLDEQKYPAELISDLYWERWQVELNFRDIKTTLGMDVLKSKTPDNVEKEILMYVIVFNVIRQLIYGAAKDHKPCQYSFKSSIQTLLGYCSEYGSKMNLSLNQLKQNLLTEIEFCVLYQRQGRVEPRELKRRTKPFKWLTRPRQEIIGELCLNCA